VEARHPDTRILAEDGGIGRAYPDDPLRGRDDHGPIFPVGHIDARLPAQELVVGAIAPDGTPVAFPVVAARAVLRDGGEVTTVGSPPTSTATGCGSPPAAGARHPPGLLVRVEPVPSDTELWTPASGTG
jgi:hypothetical protein